MLDAFKRASASRITAVIPYYGYARQDRKVAPRVPISAKLIADLVTTAGASRVLTAELHAGQIQGFFNIPVDNLFSAPVLLPYLRSRIGKEDVTIVSPDAGGVERARAFAKRLGASLAIIDKRRARSEEEKIPEKANLDVAEMRIIGDVEGRVAIIVDDMVDNAQRRRRRRRFHEAGANRAGVLYAPKGPTHNKPPPRGCWRNSLHQLIPLV
jgi:ribose-phosphate pyrophosphokinase